MLKTITICSWLILISCGTETSLDSQTLDSKNEIFDSIQKVNNVIPDFDSCANSNDLLKDSIYYDQILRFFNKKELTHVNQHVDREYGLTILFSRGVNPEYIRLDSFSNQEDYYTDKNIPHWISENIHTSIYDQEPNVLIPTTDKIFECEKIIKTGAFIDESKNLLEMSEVIENLLLIVEDGGYSPDYSQVLKEDLIFYRRIEENSLKVVFTAENSRVDKSKIAIFHFTEKNGKMYLTLMDFESYNCSV